jgi:glycosyltransferase involved in cell wall biosynthesis
MYNERKTFVMLTPGFAKDEADTTCLPFQQSFARSLKSLYPGIHLVILAFQYPYHQAAYTWEGIPVIPFSGRNKGGLTRLMLRKKINAVLRQLHQTNKIPGLLSFWCGECALVGKQFGDKHGIKHYCWIMGQDARKNNPYPNRYNPSPAELIALSDFIRDEFEKNHSIRPLNVIPPGIDKQQFPSLAVKKDIDILAAGSLISLKQYDIFLEAVAEIKKEIPSVKAVLIGEGPERNRLETLVNSFGLASTIILTGELPHQEVLQMMQRAKVFLHTSSYEGFGVVCIEALYAGATVISFVKPMYTEIQDWYIAGSKEEMIQKTLEILENPAAGDRSLSHFTIQNSVRQVMKLFDF